MNVCLNLRFESKEVSFHEYPFHFSKDSLTCDFLPLFNLYAALFQNTILFPVLRLKSDFSLSWTIRVLFFLVVRCVYSYTCFFSRTCLVFKDQSPFIPLQTRHSWLFYWRCRMFILCHSIQAWIKRRREIIHLKSFLRSLLYTWSWKEMKSPKRLKHPLEATKTSTKRSPGGKFVNLSVTFYLSSFFTDSFSLCSLSLFLKHWLKDGWDSSCEFSSLSLQGRHILVSWG